MRHHEICLTFFIYVSCSFIRTCASFSGECAVLVYADGLGFGHAAVGGIPSNSWKWSSGGVPTPDGDSSLVTSMLSTGCMSPPPGALSMTPRGRAAYKLSETFSRRGAAYALVSSKCVDDGTASAFTVSWPDRYDLCGVASAISTASPSPFLLSGGFSRSLWTAASVNGSSYVEFSTPAKSAYAETCEYPPASDFTARSADALRRAAEKGGVNGFFAVLSFAGVDMASHAGKVEDVVEQLNVLRRTLDETERFLESNCSRWKMVIVGSHDTGAMSMNGTLSHDHHSVGGTFVPLFARGVSNDAFVGVKTMGDVARLISKSMRCSEIRGFSTFPGARYHGSHYEYETPTSAGGAATVYFLYILMICLVFCIPCALYDDAYSRHRGYRAIYADDRPN